MITVTTEMNSGTPLFKGGNFFFKKINKRKKFNI